MTSQQEEQATALIVRAQQGDSIAVRGAADAARGDGAPVRAQPPRQRPWIDDVAQETLVTVHAARRTYDPRRPFAPWFYAILSSRLIDVLRKERRVSAREVGADALPEPRREGRSDDGAASGVDTEEVHAALGTLPERQREIVSALQAAR